VQGFWTVIGKTLALADKTEGNFLVRDGCLVHNDQGFQQFVGSIPAKTFIVHDFRRTFELCSRHYVVKSSKCFCPDHDNVSLALEDEKGYNA